MLTHLALKDFAVVRATELEFGPGMTVISGETGAGKSLLVDALGFLSGLRADSGVVRHGSQRAELAAGFDLAASPVARQWLREQELDEDDQCQLRPVIRADGGSRAWINGRPVTLAQLAELAGLLVEIHGQHEHQSLLSRPAQLALLDAHARNDAERAAVREAAAAWQALLDEREALQSRGDVGDRIGWLEHQLAELEREELEPEALEALDQAHRRQANAAGLIAACEEALARIDGDEGPSLTGLLHETRGGLARVAGDEPRLGEVDTLLDEFTEKLDPAEKSKRLTRVFAGVFEIINGERSTVMNGITRYAQGQRRLAERIRDEADKVSELKDSPDSDPTKVASKEVADLESQFNWDRRIFDERNQSVSYVCEVPTLL